VGRRAVAAETAGVGFGAELWVLGPDLRTAAAAAAAAGPFVFVISSVAAMMVVAV
jgi:hypothetical protein